jgi:hypothetical protein
MRRGRERECARVREFLNCARQGLSTSLVVLAEPGMGKTALLGYATDMASGMRVLSVEGVASESGLPFACPHRLVSELAEYAEDIPEVQRGALLGALALGPPRRSADRFLLHVAVLSLLGVVAESGPVLIAIDDAQWLDQPTADICGFVIRRLGADGIAVLVAGREGEMPAAFGQFPSMSLPGLDPAAVEELLVDRAAVLEGAARGEVRAAHRALAAESAGGHEVRRA